MGCEVGCEVGWDGMRWGRIKGRREGSEGVDVALTNAANPTPNPLLSILHHPMLHRTLTLNPLLLPLLFLRTEVGADVVEGAEDVVEHGVARGCVGFVDAESVLGVADGGLRVGGRGRDG